MSDISFLTPCDDAPYLLWGTFWDATSQTADWAVSADASNPGGLAVGDPIATAVIIGLFTDKRCPVDHPLARMVEGDPRGWFGDGVDVRVDLYEQELGSLLWLLERATVTEDNRRWAEVFAYDGLSPLLACGGAQLLETSATMWPERNAITLDVRLAGSLAGKPFDLKFAQIWTSRQGNVG